MKKDELSTFNNKLEKKDLRIEHLLDEDDVVSQLKNGNQNLIIM